MKLQSSILCLSLTLGMPFYSPVYAQTDTVNTYQIPAGELDAVLKAFALASGIEFHLDARLSEGFYSAGLDGQFTPEQGLNTLLTSTGLTAHRQADGSYQITDSTESLTLDTLDVSFSEGEISRDEAGKYAVYDDNRSTVYASKKRLSDIKVKMRLISLKVCPMCTVVMRATAEALTQIFEVFKGRVVCLSSSMVQSKG
ncbi:STN domain-containing protein [Salinivibrio sp. PR5]|uniref:STN domain-containing protein n=1 Tax=Salinivibrio sp. PR5 TaxID=1909484 RepID=UPI0010553458|nr:STN domain-containing protein [Salinivibrio sp. PR5]